MTLSFIKPCIFAILTVSTASATMIAPGATALPDAFTTVSSTLTQLAATGTININPIPGTSFSANYTETVYRDTANVYCSTCLDFIITVSNAGPGVFERVSTSLFGTFLTDVGINTAGPTGVIPSSVSRSATGDVIGFNFIPPGTAVSAGQQTAVLEIQTNATSFTTGTVSVQDGSSGFGTGFVPTATPEPAYMGLIGLTMLGIGLIRRRKVS